MEMGNIVCAAYVGVLGTFLGKGVMIGTPEMLVGAREELEDPTAHGLVIETDFTFLDTTFEGVFVLSHSDVSFASLLTALGFRDVGAPAARPPPDARRPRPSDDRLSPVLRRRAPRAPARAGRRRRGTCWSSAAASRARRRRATRRGAGCGWRWWTPATWPAAPAAARRRLIHGGLRYLETGEPQAWSSRPARSGAACWRWPPTWCTPFPSSSPSFAGPRRLSQAAGGDVAVRRPFPVPQHRAPPHARPRRGAARRSRSCAPTGSWARRCTTTPRWTTRA